ncbi:MAG: orotidine-5'-phosphate decarboxylase [Clostridium sp.]
MIIDKLYNIIEKNGHVCLGLDTDITYIPKWFLEKYPALDDALYQFNKAIIDETLDVVACYKVQIAYYEAYGLKGLNAYHKTLEYIKKVGAISIADIKRGDISKTAEMYAKAHFSGDFESDFITLNPYMGLDSIEPYLDYLKNNEKGVFVLVRTSNPGAKDLEYVELKDGRRVYDLIGEKIQDLGMNYMGNCGYSSIGGVVGCTDVKEGSIMREQLNKMFFLIPGYGAQGGAAKDVSVYLKGGNGGVVNSSRGILLAYKKVENGEENFAKCSRDAAILMRDDILNALK